MTTATVLVMAISGTEVLRVEAPPGQLLAAIVLARLSEVLLQRQEDLVLLLSAVRVGPMEYITVPSGGIVLLTVVALLSTTPAGWP